MGGKESIFLHRIPMQEIQKLEPQAKNDNSVPKVAADDNLKQEVKSPSGHILTVKCQSQKTEAATDSQHRAEALAIPELRMELMKIILTNL
ncbi:MAG: hypothetical protein ACLR2O_07890 [Coprococcus sp.]